MKKGMNYRLKGGLTQENCQLWERAAFKTWLLGAFNYQSREPSKWISKERRQWQKPTKEELNLTSYRVDLNKKGENGWFDDKRERILLIMRQEHNIKGTRLAICLRYVASLSNAFWKVSTKDFTKWRLMLTIFQDLRFVFPRLILMSHKLKSTKQKRNHFKSSSMMTTMMMMKKVDFLYGINELTQERLVMFTKQREKRITEKNSLIKTTCTHELNRILSNWKKFPRLPLLAMCICFSTLFYLPWSLVTNENSIEFFRSYSHRQSKPLLLWISPV